MNIVYVVIIPVALAYMYIYSLTDLKPVRYGDYEYPGEEIKLNYAQIVNLKKMSKFRFDSGVRAVPPADSARLCRLLHTVVHWHAQVEGQNGLEGAGAGVDKDDGQVEEAEAAASRRREVRKGRHGEQEQQIIGLNMSAAVQKYRRCGNKVRRVGSPNVCFSVLMRHTQSKHIQSTFKVSRSAHFQGSILLR